MPIYEYACQKCGEKREELVNSSANPQPPACPRCGKPMKRAFSAFAVKGGPKGQGGGCGHSCGGGFG